MTDMDNSNESMQGKEPGALDETRAMPGAAGGEESAAEETPDAGGNEPEDGADADAASARKRKRIVAGIAAAAVVAALGLGCAWASGAFDAAQEPQKVENESKEGPVAAEVEERAAVTASEIEGIVKSLSFDGEDVSLQGDFEVVLKDGRVMVTHTVGDLGDPRSALDVAAKQAAALAGELRDQGVIDVTWVVAGTDGGVHIAVAEKPEDAPASGTTEDILGGSDGYVISDGVYEGIGGEESGIPQTGGTAPTTPDGDEIKPGESAPEVEGGESAGEPNGGEAGGNGSSSSSGGAVPGGGVSSGSNGGSSSGGSASGGSSGGNGSGNASDSGGSSSSSGSGGSSEPSAPVHTHSYTIPVWGTVQEWSDGEGYSCETYYTCNGCGENWSAAHAAENAKKGDNSHGTYTVHNRESWTKEPGYYPVDNAHVR